MKKIVAFIISFIVILMISGCEQKPAVINDNYDNVEYIFTKIEKFEFEGHRYIWFANEANIVNGYGKGATGGIVHDPNCTCMIDYD
ncbi:MAG: hypothetical protein IJH39_12685 [Clostridia bacterium]|nr:hypothetical protein [Clostridia bacterium]